MGTKAEASVTREQVLHQIIRLLGEIVGLDTATISEDSTIDGELEMNSVAFVELQVALEEEYDVQLDPILVVELNRLGDIVGYIHECATGATP